jgi:DNA-binding transcriptional LysR family regulator
MSLPLLSTATRYFMAVVRTGSVSEAAAQVHVAPSAVSRQVAKLEEGMGCVLFERQARGMVLTEAGERLAAWVHGAMQDTERVAQDVRDLAGQRNSRIHIACTEGFTPGFMPNAMASFRARHPGTSIHLQVGTPADVSRWLLRGEADIGVKFSVAPEKGLHIELNRQAPIMALAAPSHPLARRKSISVAELVRHPLSLPDASTTVRQALDLCCSLQGLQYQIVYSGDFATLLALAIKGETLTLSSYLGAAHAVSAGLLVAVPVAEPPFEQRSVQVLSLQGRTLDALTRGFADHLAAAIDAASGSRKRR